MTKLKESCSDIINCESKTIEDKVSDNCLSVKNVMIACFKGGTPKYVEKSKTLVLNQKCIRNNAIDFSFAQYIPDDSIKNPEKEIKVGDLLINSTGEGTAGRCAFVSSLPDNIRVTVDSHMLIVRFSNLELSRIFSYFFYNNEKLMLSLLTGSSGQGEFDKERAFNIKFPYNKKNQRVFCYIFDRIAHKIELNNKINRELEKTAKDLYNYWFVQFDFPDGNKRPYKSSGGKMVYNDVLKREIPEGWEVESIADNKLSSILKPGIDAFDTHKIYLPTAAIEGDGIIDRSNIITYTNREGRANMQPVTNSVWFAKMKNTKKVLYFGDYSTERIDSTILSTGMLGLKCNDYALEYVWNFVNNDNFEAIKDKLAHGATQEGVNNEDLLYFPMLIPTKNILQNYSSMLRDLYKQKYLNELENEHLAETRDFLLPMLMNGQVSVS